MNDPVGITQAPSVALASSVLANALACGSGNENRRLDATISVRAEWALRYASSGVRALAMQVIRSMPRATLVALCLARSVAARSGEATEHAVGLYSGHPGWTSIQCSADLPVLEFVSAKTTPGLNPKLMRDRTDPGLLILDATPSVERRNDDQVVERRNDDQIVLWPFSKLMEFSKVNPMEAHPGRYQLLRHWNWRNYNPTQGVVHEGLAPSLRVGGDEIATLQAPIEEARRVTVAVGACFAGGENDAECINDYGAPLTLCNRALTQAVFVTQVRNPENPYNDAWDVFIVLNDPEVRILYDVDGEVQELVYRIADHHLWYPAAFALPSATHLAYQTGGCAASTTTRALPICDPDWERTWGWRTWNRLDAATPSP